MKHLNNPHTKPTVNLRKLETIDSDFKVTAIRERLFNSTKPATKRIKLKTLRFQEARCDPTAFFQRRIGWTLQETWHWNHQMSGQRNQSTNLWVNCLFSIFCVLYIEFAYEEVGVMGRDSCWIIIPWLPLLVAPLTISLARGDWRDEIPNKSSIMWVGP